jgi:hypothetical protein
VLSVPMPDEFTKAVANNAVPLKKLMVPKAAPVGTGAMVAVKETTCPAATVLGERLSVVVVVVCGTAVNEIGSDVLAARSVSPG